MAGAAGQSSPSGGLGEASGEPSPLAFDTDAHPLVVEPEEPEHLRAPLAREAVARHLRQASVQGSRSEVGDMSCLPHAHAMHMHTHVYDCYMLRLLQPRLPTSSRSSSRIESG